MTPPSDTSCFETSAEEVGKFVAALNDEQGVRTGVVPVRIPEDADPRLIQAVKRRGPDVLTERQRKELAVVLQRLKREGS